MDRWNRSASAAAMVLAATLLAGGCTTNGVAESTGSPSASPPPVTDPSPPVGTATGPETWEPGAFIARPESGAIIRISMPASEELVTEIESYRERTGGKPVVYFATDVDNRGGIEEVNLEEINLYDPDGLEHSFIPVWRWISDWEELTDDIDLANEGVDLHNDLLGGVAVSERKTLLFAGEHLPNEVTDVQVSDGFTVTHAGPDEPGEVTDAQANEAFIATARTSHPLLELLSDTQLADFGATACSAMSQVSVSGLPANEQAAAVANEAEIMDERIAEMETALNEKLGAEDAGNADGVGQSVYTAASILLCPEHGELATEAFWSEQ
ncbi:hypothetical protein EDD34_3087 [Myceligenerans xiligouense]|uniref:Uncharacterized protein n=2 Tax=Myceligenerans xiligouense TaxID=253184 RepID=A0A3N4YQQ0_9MICO|nr:hypothetical protein EDD34_3087 [Myceligenerans xiligouense]